MVKSFVKAKVCNDVNLAATFDFVIASWGAAPFLFYFFRAWLFCCRYVKQNLHWGLLFSGLDYWTDIFLIFAHYMVGFMESC